MGGWRWLEAFSVFPSRSLKNLPAKLLCDFRGAFACGDGLREPLSKSDRWR